MKRRSMKLYQLYCCVCAQLPADEAVTLSVKRHRVFFPCCMQALPTWPNVLSTGTKPSTSNGQAAANGNAGAAAPDTSGAAASRQGASRLQRLNIAVRKRSVGAQVLLSEHVQALWHTYKPLTRPDRSLLERLVRRWHPRRLLLHLERSRGCSCLLL